MKLQVHLHAADIDGIAAPLQCLTCPGNRLFFSCEVQPPAVHVERPRPRLQRFGPRYAPTTFRSRYRIKEPWGVRYFCSAVRKAELHNALCCSSETEATVSRATPLENGESAMVNPIKIGSKRSIEALVLQMDIAHGWRRV
jgi:hypothetical protein